MISIANERKEKVVEMKKSKFLILLALVATLALTGCGSGEKKAESSAAGSSAATASSETAKASEAAGSSSEAAKAETTGKMTGEINVVSREDGSGTRGAFTEITGVLAKENGKDVDKTFDGAAVQNSTDNVLTYVAGDKASIGYISLGSLNDSVKAVKVEGVAPSPATVKDKTYKIARPLNITYHEEKLTDVTKDFISFIFSKEGQDLANTTGFIAVDDKAAPYKASKQFDGKITIQGSTSVAPLMEKLIEAYNKVQPNVKIEITANGSTAGITAAKEGNADIGMASRELKEKEAAVLQHKEIALDGIAVIVNKENPVDDLTLEQIKQIFTGEVRNWDGL